MNDAPLACAHCGHDIGQHHPGEYGKDHCHGKDCKCDGFAIRRTS